MVIKLLQAIYDPETPLPTDPEFYKGVLKDIQFFGIASQVYYLLKEQNNLDKTPDFFQEALKKDYEEALFNSLLIKSETVKILDRFEALGIEVIPLKGVFFAEKYFGHIGARATTDIDLLVKPEQIEEAVECVKEMGFTDEEKYPSFHYHYVFCKKIFGLSKNIKVEIHQHVLRSKTSELNINSFLEKAIPLKNYKFVKELSNFHTFYYICLHGWKHKLNSIKYFIDIVQLIHGLQCKINYCSLLNYSDSQKTFHRINNTISTVYREFPHLNSVISYPYQKKSLLIWNYEQIRNLKYKDDHGFRLFLNLYEELKDYDTMKQRLVILKRFLFPDRLEIPINQAGKKILIIQYFLLFKVRIKKILFKSQE